MKTDSPFLSLDFITSIAVSSSEEKDKHRYCLRRPFFRADPEIQYLDILTAFFRTEVDQYSFKIVDYDYQNLTTLDMWDIMEKKG